MADKFVANDFKVPLELVTKKYRLRMLKVSDLKQDYQAVISSIGHLQKTKPFGPKSDWPTKELTLEQDLIDLGWHQKEFQNKTSFAYTAMALDGSKCLGCVYIYPSKNPIYEVIVILWVRESEIANGLDEDLFSYVKKWIKEKWPFKKVAYPGRDLSWQEYDN
jgi:hypothetical protein